MASTYSARRVGEEARTACSTKSGHRVIKKGRGSPLWLPEYRAFTTDRIDPSCTHLTEIVLGEGFTQGAEIKEDKEQQKRKGRPSEPMEAFLGEGLARRSLPSLWSDASEDLGKSGVDGFFVASPPCFSAAALGDFLEDAPWRMLLLCRSDRADLFADQQSVHGDRHLFGDPGGDHGVNLAAVVFAVGEEDDGALFERAVAKASKRSGDGIADGGVVFEDADLDVGDHLAQHLVIGSQGAEGKGFSSEKHHSKAIFALTFFFAPTQEGGARHFESVGQQIALQHGARNIESKDDIDPFVPTRIVSEDVLGARQSDQEQKQGDGRQKLFEGEECCTPPDRGVLKELEG